MILGGFLMLPATFIHDTQLRISKLAIGIFAVAILAAGLALTGLLTFAVRNRTFQADSIYLPALMSCTIGLLTVFYSFLINERYYWNTPAYLSIVVAVLGILAYCGLLVYTHRKSSRPRSRPNDVPAMPSPQRDSASRENLVPRYQDSAYYDNYIRNMYPSSAHAAPSTPRTPAHDVQSISEEEMQRQQMLMLLLQNAQTPTPEASQSTFRIDWQDQDRDEEVSPASGYYAPGTHSSGTVSSAYPLSSISRQFSDHGLRPWDGVWRDPMPASMQAPSRAQMADRGSREERRRQIESGR